MLKNYKLTIILPLFGRDELTKVWIAENYNSKYKYIIADGGKDNKNKDIFENFIRENINYIKFPTDIDCRTYVNKMYLSSTYVDTPYVITVDNDDIINPKGIDKCIKTLDENNNYSCVSGKIKFIKQHNEKIYSFSLNSHSSKDLSNLNSDLSIKTYLDPYLKNNKYLWYSIYRKKNYELIWRNMRDAEIDDWHFLERAQTTLSILFGRFYFINTTHYIRKIITGKSFAQKISKETKHFDYKIFHDDFYFKKLEKFSKYLDTNFNYKNFIENYIFYVKNYKVKRSIINLCKVIILRMFRFRYKTIIILSNIFS